MKIVRSHFDSSQVWTAEASTHLPMVWSPDFVHRDLVISPDATTVHRTTDNGWHGFVGTSTFRTGVHTFTLSMSGYWAVGVVAADMNFRLKSYHWCSTTLAWDGTYGVTKNAAIDVTTNPSSILGWDAAHSSPRKLQMKVDMVANTIAFRDSVDKEWTELPDIVLPSSLRLWGSLGSKNMALAVTATESQHDHCSLHATLARDIGAFCYSEKHADICLVVGNARIPAHSLILAARSATFASMLTAPTKGTINIAAPQGGRSGVWVCNFLWYKDGIIKETEARRFRRRQGFEEVSWTLNPLPGSLSSIFPPPRPLRAR